jgi:high-affinity iron transporter
MGAMLGVAIVMLIWYTVWVARHGRQHASEMRSVGEAVVGGAKPLAGVTVPREGIEVRFPMASRLLRQAPVRAS